MAIKRFRSLVCLLVLTVSAGVVVHAQDDGGVHAQDEVSYSTSESFSDETWGVSSELLQSSTELIPSSTELIPSSSEIAEELPPQERQVPECANPVTMVAW